MERERRNKLFRGIRRGVAGTVLLLLLWGGCVEPNLLTVKRCAVPIPGLPRELENTRAVVIGDTHFGSSFLERWRMKRILRRVLQEKPDTVWLLGDYAAVGGFPGYRAMRESDFMTFFAAMCSAAPLGAYAVLGNHELWYGREKMRFLLEKSGVQMIENKVVMLGGRLALAGVPDGGTVPFDRKDFNKLLEGHDPLLLLSHKGRMLKSVTHGYSGIMVAADTHGGQIRLPGAGALKDRLKGKKELTPGLSERWGKKLFITTGAGGHRLNFRFFCPPEIVVLTLKRAGGNS